ncbi:hypothetical protein MOK15_10820 [Sphingobium sp. BYY-5]|uniref:hypothetical protein n=1 Tax=Sphingobium sp. BYY-5 TaxID=2926400 RepID=UPI001FA79A92|nr:hypothetical protein [Sphingobium sp. BYY-5]MCI4590586.1 hypothetical protein [Sphingobium sp. BYY-5]
MEAFFFIMPRDCGDAETWQALQKNSTKQEEMNRNAAVLEMNLSIHLKLKEKSIKGSALVRDQGRIIPAERHS